MVKYYSTRSTACASPVVPGTTIPLAAFLVISFFLLFFAGSCPTAPCTGSSGAPSAAEMMAPAVRGGGGYHAASGRRCGPYWEEETAAAASRRASLQEITAAAAAPSRYISYEFLKADAVPCSRPGLPYYNCHALTRANPYSRGCLTITRCARDSGP